MPVLTITESTVEQPHQLSVVVKTMFVNGTMIVLDEKYANAKPRRVLWGSGARLKSGASKLRRLLVRTHLRR